MEDQNWNSLDLCSSIGLVGDGLKTERHESDQIEHLWFFSKDYKLHSFVWWWSFFKNRIIELKSRAEGKDQTCNPLDFPSLTYSNYLYWDISSLSTVANYLFLPRIKLTRTDDTLKTAAPVKCTTMQMQYCKSMSRNSSRQGTKRFVSPSSRKTLMIISFS